MTKQLGLALLAALAAPLVAHGQHAVEVIDFDPGSTPQFDGFSNNPGFLTIPSAALGAPEVITGEGEDITEFNGLFFGGPTPVSVFNPPSLRDEIVSIGEGGSLTLRLSNFALPGDGPELGFFSNVGLIDGAFPGSVATDPAGSFSPPGVAEIEVSEDGVNFVSLGEHTFDIPTNAFQNPASSVLADPTLPFTGELDDFAGLPFSDPNNPDVLDLLAGSAGGLWIDIEDSGLSQVGFVRLSVADDGNPLVNLNFELDAVSVAGVAIGAAVPEPSTLLLVLSAMTLSVRRRNA